MSSDKSGRARVALLYPKTGWDIKNVTTLLPLSILYLVKPLKAAGYRVDLIDQRIDRDWEKSVADAAADPATVFFGISAMTGLQIHWGLAAARIFKARSEAPVVWGGIHASLLPEQTLTDELVDLVALNEGEGLVVPLADAIASGSDLSQVPGIGFFRDGEIIRTDPAPVPELDDVLIPDYSCVKISDYLTTQTLGVTDIAVTTSRGCPNRCAYCYNIPYSGRRWRAQSASGVVEHFKRLQRDFGVDGILIKDDNFYVNKKRAREIADGLSALSRPLLIRGECRADYIARQWEPDFLDFLAARGFREMTVGAESGSDATLELLCKDITVEDIRLANQRLGKAGIAVKFTFMTGYPNETQADVKKTLGLMLDLVRENPLARVTPLHLFAPYPGTELFEKSRALGYRPPETLAGWSKVNFHQADLPWVPAEQAARLEKASVATYFLDGRTVPEYFSRSPLMRIAAKIYGAVVRWRAKRFFFDFMPELALFEWFRKKKKMT